MFVINKTQGTVDYFGGMVVIARGGYVELNDEQLADAGVLATKAAGWVDFSATKPTTSAVKPLPEIVIQTAADDGGSSEFPGVETAATEESSAPAPKKAGKKAAATPAAPEEASAPALN